MQTITNDTPISVLTVGQLKEILSDASTSREYMHGLAGIQELFGVSHSTAQHYKDTFLKPAIMQHGRKIIIDVARARELFGKKMGGRR